MIHIFPYLLICVALAADNSDRIAAGKRIFHGLNGALHIAAAIALTYYTDWQNGVSLLLCVRMVFDSALSHFRSLPWTYLPLNPKSVIDRVEKYIFKTKKLAYVVYIAAVVVLQIFR